MSDYSQLLPPDSNWRRNLRLLRRHARFGGRGTSAKLSALRRLFISTNTWLRELGVDYWLDFGTLLGWHRDGDIIAHDTDLDFGLPLEAYPRLCAAADNLPAGFTLHDSSHRHHGPKLYLQSEGWEADFDFHIEANEQLKSTLRSHLPGDTLPFARSHVYPLKQDEFLGEKTSIPHNPIALLEHRYSYIGSDAVLDRGTGYYRPRSGIE